MSLRPTKPSPLVPGYRLDRYELLCPIAQGGMASVWVARQIGKHGFEKQVAVKTILPEFAEDPRFQKMFLDEAHIASNIEHANVAQILDLGEEHGVLYLVMELVDGDSLSKLHRVIEKKDYALPPGIIVRILADACSGLHAAHELQDKKGAPLGVVHRDISPQNILVSQKGIAKLIDFGVAKARDRLAGDTNAGMLKGKVQYMAPEQAVGKAIDRRADVWGAGAILYHLLTGRPAYDGPNQLATLHRLTSGRPPEPLPRSVPAPIADVVLRTLVHDVDKRIATALDLATALEDALVASNCVTTTAEVAGYVREHLRDRAEARRKSIGLAISAANERARIHDALKIDADSSAGLTDVPKRMAALIAAATPQGEPPTMPGLPSHRRAAEESGTMAALEASAPSPDRRRRAIFIVAGVSLAAALLLVFALGRKTATAPEPVKTAAAAPTENVAPTPTVAATPSPAKAVAAAAPSHTAVVTKPKPVVVPKTKPTANVKKPKVDDGF